jgi:hypothetical protein
MVNKYIFIYFQFNVFKYFKMFMPAAVELKTQRNCNKVEQDGYMYTFDRQSSDGNTKFWRCERKNQGCKGRLHTDRNNNTKQTVRPHNHDSNAALVSAKKYLRVKLTFLLYQI